MSFAQSSKIAVGVFHILAVAFLTGCSSTKLDRPAIEQSKRIGTFTWRGQPFYHESVGSGIMGSGASIGNAIFSAASGKTRQTIQSMYNSGVYDSFSDRLVALLSTQVSAKVSQLSDTNYVLRGTGNKQKVDVLESARAQGYDVVLEATVWPSLSESQPDVTQGIASAASVKADIVVKRCSDGKVLWKKSIKTFSQTSSYDFRALGQQAADEAVKMYSAGR